MASDTALLRVLRGSLILTGTRYAPGVSLCVACMVLADGKPVRRLPMDA